MDIANQILLSREEKKDIINKYIKDYQIITMKANIAGMDKNIKEAYILLSYFDNYLSKYCLKKNIFKASDGPYIIYQCAKEKNLKNDMINFEENDSLGRFVDIDVYLDNNTSITRNKPRKCYLCENFAFVCGRLQTHTVKEINDFLGNSLIIQLHQIIINLCDESIMSELNLHPKFGLVTPFTNGSHPDMDYQLMINAKNAIIPYFMEMFDIGYNHTDISEIFKLIRNVGLKAEQAMYISTNNINAYKGLIFALGLVVTSVAIKLSNLASPKTCFDYIKEMTKGITKESNESQDTFGKVAYQKYGIKGARNEAESGFNSVQLIINNYELDCDESMIKALCNLIYIIDDTVLFKRCKNNINFYNEVKIKFKNFKYNQEYIQELNDFCIKNNLSFGGSADLLIVSVFMKKINKIFNFSLFN